MSHTKKMYQITRNHWPSYGRISLLWTALAGSRLGYFSGIALMALEALITFTGPVIVKLTLDSVIGSVPPSVPAPMDRLAQWLLGAGFSGGGVLPLPAGAVPAAGEWIWRPWFRSHLWVLALAFIGCILLQAVVGFLASYSVNRAAEATAKRMRDRLYGHIQDLPYESLLRADSGDWLQRCTTDVDTTRRFIAAEAPELVRTFFLVAIALPILFSLNARLALIGCAVMPVIILFSFFFHVVVARIFRGVDEREGVLTGIVQETVTGVRVVRSFAREEYETARFAAANDSFRDQVYRLIAWLAFYWGFSSFLGILQIAGVITAALFFMIDGSITIGLLVLFITYEQQILWPVRQFGRILADAGKMSVALGRMAELLALPPEEELEACFIDESWVPDTVEFEHVSFSYPDGTAVLKDISFSMRAGEQLAIVGPTGSGKSTLVHLLIRLYEPDSGRILLGGRDIREIPKRVLRQKVSLVLQESFLYGKTIRNNIADVQEEADEAALVDAARTADFHRVAEGFPHRYETMVGERGVTLSGGQRQRLALTRALARKANLLVLDDSLSAVDTVTDLRIRENLSGRGCIIIAHRLTTLASASRILVMEDGRITDRGTHDELSSRPGLYRRLAELQKALGRSDNV